MPFIMLDGTRNKIIEQGKYSWESTILHTNN
jgi:hypothetical protein